MNPRQHSSDVIFWDVDTQIDLMTPPEQGGDRYVRDRSDASDEGAASIVPLLAKLSEFAVEHDILRVATGEWHQLEHREVDPVKPDLPWIHPQHDPSEADGLEKIPETALRNPLVIPLRADPAMAWDVERRAIREGRDIFIQKDEDSCFTGNPATEALLEALDPKLVIVYGVALDASVKHAVEGMLDRGWSVCVVEDATRGYGEVHAERLLHAWEERGAVRTTTAEVLGGSIPKISFDGAGTGAAPTDGR